LKKKKKKAAEFATAESGKKFMETTHQFLRVNLLRH